MKIEHKDCVWGCLTRKCDAHHLRQLNDIDIEDLEWLKYLIEQQIKVLSSK